MMEENVGKTKKSILKRKEHPNVVETEASTKRVEPPQEMGEEWEDVDTEFEDDYEDEYEDEEIVENEEVCEDEKENENMEIEEEKIDSKKRVKFDNKTKEKSSIKPFLGSNKNLKEGETLEFSNSAYTMLHRVTTEWPCLSFDVILPQSEQCEPGKRSYQKMNKYPYSVHLVAGSQGASRNAIYVMEMSKLHKTKYDDDSEGENIDSEDSDYEEDPEIKIKQIQVKHSVNRLVSLWNTPVVSVWHDNGDVAIYNLENKMNEFEEGKPHSKSKSNEELVQTFKNKEEGYAINFSPLKKGLLVSGSNDSKIFTYEPNSGLNSWARQETPYTFHKAAVEDIQFSPVEEFAFASCSVDCSVRVCDLRVGNRKEAQISILKAHESDVNVLSWNRANPFLIASGADDGCFKVWDLKYPKSPISEILWHTESITSLCFQPNDESVLAVSSDDNRLSMWDFSCEPENPEENDMEEEIPDQMIFLHQGQDHIKEIRFHPLLTEMIISTSLDGFHLFKPAIDEMPEDEVEDENEEEIPQIKLSDLDNYLSRMKISK